MTRSLSTFVSVILVVFLLWRSYEMGFEAGYNTVFEDSLTSYQQQIDVANEQALRMTNAMIELDAATTKENMDLRHEIYALKELSRTYVPSDMCLDTDWLYIHDAAARLPKSENAAAASVDDGTTAGPKADQALKVVVDNYGECALYIKQIESLQGYIRAVLNAQ